MKTLLYYYKSNDLFNNRQNIIVKLYNLIFPHILNSLYHTNNDNDTKYINEKWRR